MKRVHGFVTSYYNFYHLIQLTFVVHSHCRLLYGRYEIIGNFNTSGDCKMVSSCGGDCGSVSICMLRNCTSDDVLNSVVEVKPLNASVCWIGKLSVVCNFPTAFLVTEEGPLIGFLITLWVVLSTELSMSVSNIIGNCSKSMSTNAKHLTTITDS